MPAPRLSATIRSRLGPNGAAMLLGLVGVVIMSIATWIAAEIYEAVVARDGLASLDQPTLRAMVAVRRPGLDAAATAFTTVGGPVVSPIVAGVVVLYLAWRWRSAVPVTLMLVASAGSLAMTLVGKKDIGRVRPDHVWAVPPYEYSPSFPSGHSLNAVVVGGIIAYLLICHVRRRGARVAIAVIAALYALLMGLSRVYLGHHWLTDVLTGWTLGLGWLLFVVTIHQVVAGRVSAARIARPARAGAGEVPGGTSLRPDDPEQAKEGPDRDAGERDRRGEDGEDETDGADEVPGRVRLEALPAGHRGVEEAHVLRVRAVGDVGRVAQHGEEPEQAVEKEIAAHPKEDG